MTRDGLKGRRGFSKVFSYNVSQKVNDYPTEGTPSKK
jgi:hypothetical protein